MRLHGFFEERRDFCNVISHHCFGAPRKGDAVSTPACLLFSAYFCFCEIVRFFSPLLLLVNQSAASRESSCFPKHTAALNKKQAAQNAKERFSKTVKSLSSFPRRSFFNIWWRIERSAAGSSEAHLHPASLQRIKETKMRFTGVPWIFLTPQTNWCS